MSSTRNIALVFMTKAEENIRVLRAIAKFNRFHDRWAAFVDDDAQAWSNPDWILGSGTWHGAICKHYAPLFFERCLSMGIPCVDLSDYPVRTPGIPPISPTSRIAPSSRPSTSSGMVRARASPCWRSRTK